MTNMMIWALKLSISHFAAVIYPLLYRMALTYMSILLTQELFQQSYEEERLKSTLNKFYGDHHKLIDIYDIFVSQPTSDRFSQS